MNLRMRQSYDNPLNGDLNWLERVVETLERERSDAPEPFGRPKDYETIRDTLRSINKATGKEYSSLGEYFLSLMPNEESRDNFKKYLETTE